jgi:hypothetical protein
VCGLAHVCALSMEAVRVRDPYRTARHCHAHFFGRRVHLRCACCEPQPSLHLQRNSFFQCDVIYALSLWLLVRPTRFLYTCFRWDLPNRIKPLCRGDWCMCAKQRRDLRVHCSSQAGLTHRTRAGSLDARWPRRVLRHHRCWGLLYAARR